MQCSWLCVERRNPTGYAFPVFNTIYDMENNNSLSEKLIRLVGSSGDYIENKVELEVLKAADKIARTTSLLAFYLVASASAMLIIGLLCLGFVAWINEAINSSYAGYFVVSGIVLFCTIVLLVAGRRTIRKKVINTILNNIDHE